MKKKKNTKKKIEKETREYRIIYSNSGNGYTGAKISLPFEWLEDMGISPDDRNVDITYRPRTKTLSIKKKSSETSIEDDKK